MKTDLIMAKVSFLKHVLDPDWVDGGPGQPGPVFQPATADYAVAELVQHIAVNLKSHEVSKKLHLIAGDLADAASEHLAAGLDDGDLCPPYRPRPPKHEPISPLWSDPMPYLWVQTISPAMNEIVLGHALRDLASLTTSEKASGAIRQVGETLVKAASARLFDDYCGTPVRPRPIPKKALAV